MTAGIYESAFPKFVTTATPPVAAPVALAPPSPPRPISIPCEVLHLAAACDKGSEVRKTDLRQVRFGRDAQGCYAVATDAKLLALARWEEADSGEPCDFGVSGRMVAAALETAERLDHFVSRVEATPGCITVTARPTPEFKQSYTFADAAEIGKFPPWLDILHASQKRDKPEEGTGTLRVDPVLWTRVGALFQAVIGDDDLTTIRIRYADHQHPILYESDGPSLVKLTVLLMTLSERKY